MLQQPTRAGRITRDQHVHVGQRVEQEMRFDLRLQRHQLRAHDLLLGLFALQRVQRGLPLQRRQLAARPIEIHRAQRRQHGDDEAHAQAVGAPGLVARAQDPPRHPLPERHADQHRGHHDPRQDPPAGRTVAPQQVARNIDQQPHRQPDRLAVDEVVPEGVVRLDAEGQHGGNAGIDGDDPGERAQPAHGDAQALGKRRQRHVGKHAADLTRRGGRVKAWAIPHQRPA